jgi:AcrR family transcriptional regulator
LSEISTPALAVEAGTATLYRWWPTKEAIALDAYLEDVDKRLPFDAKVGSPLRRLRDQARGGVRFLTSDAGRVLVRLIMAIQEDQQLRQRFLKRVYLPRREKVLVVIDEAIAMGELPHNMDRDTLVDAIYGPVYYRLFMGHLALTEEFVDDVFSAALTGVSANAKQRSNSRSHPRTRG